MPKTPNFDENNVIQAGEAAHIVENLIYRRWRINSMCHMTCFKGIFNTV